MGKTGKEFLEAIAPVAEKKCKEYGLRASVCIAQTILESGWGKNAIAEYNVFGRKWAGKGEYVVKTTHEEKKNGEIITIEDKFRKYDSYDEALYSYCELISHKPYEKVKPQYASLDKYITELAKVYCTDSHYKDKITKIIEENDLTKYDA
jgi:flagellum-specific peptidoglycan hydrolase FlgJ